MACVLGVVNRLTGREYPIFFSYNSHVITCSDFLSLHVEFVNIKSWHNWTKSFA